jgi:formate dehydrogenase iron-sulfur subunit
MTILKFGFDRDICIGCAACEVACKIENEVPLGIRRRKVVAVEKGEYPEVEKYFVSMACMHCNNPPCQAVCPVKTISKRDDDGIVLVNKNKCIGCGYCLYACPFGAPQFPETGLFGSKGKMDKCTFCTQRIDRGEKPACVTACTTKALIVGNASKLETRKRERAARKLISIA